MKKFYILLFIPVVIFALAMVGLNCSSRKSLSLEGQEDRLNNGYRIYAAFIPDEVEFAGEQVPLDKFYVRESLDRELLVNTYWHTSTLLMFKRANRWFPTIEPILRKNRIPDDFKFLALIESGLMNVVSPSGATGFWQFLEGTAKDYGLEVNEQVDERYNVEKATHAACKYLNDAYEKYGNWALVAASYNAGKNRIDEELTLQQVDNYYDLYLSEETSRYVFRMMAVKLIFENPENYGFHLEKSDLYKPIPTKEIKIGNSITDLRAYARDLGINYKLLKEFNPWLRKDSLVVNWPQEYVIKVPR